MCIGVIQRATQRRKPATCQNDIDRATTAAQRKNQCVMTRTPPSRSTLCRNRSFGQAMNIRFCTRTRDTARQQGRRERTRRNHRKTGAIQRQDEAQRADLWDVEVLRELLDDARAEAPLHEDHVQADLGVHAVQDAHVLDQLRAHAARRHRSDRQWDESGAPPQQRAGRRCAVDTNDAVSG